VEGVPRCCSVSKKLCVFVTLSLSKGLQVRQQEIPRLPAVARNDARPK